MGKNSWRLFGPPKVTKYWCDKCQTLRGKEMMKKGRVVCYECGATLQEIKVKKQNE